MHFKKFLHATSPIPRTLMEGERIFPCDEAPEVLVEV